jgi:hypothetical protein
VIKGSKEETDYLVEFLASKTTIFSGTIGLPGNNAKVIFYNTAFYRINFFSAIFRFLGLKEKEAK